ncbi:MAG TPA: DUF4390 domain-containing protein [Paucimonas sp.]|nr:DUF4390 domain-containing protein [Paucimonas sp.]
MLTWILAPAAQAAEGVDITQANIEHTDEGYRLSVAFSFDLTRGLEEAVTHGVPLVFTTDIEITRPRWYWFDERAVNTSQSIRISYDPLTRRYHAARKGHLGQSFSTLDDALATVRRPGRLLVGERGTFKPGENYTVSVRMRLDVAQLSKPFQVHALNSSDWRLSSDWKTFNFRAE